jgi:hypothetical protein
VSDIPAEQFPVVDPRETIGSMTRRVSAVPSDDRSWRWWWIALALSTGMLAFGLFGVG